MNRSYGYVGQTEGGAFAGGTQTFVAAYDSELAPRWSHVFQAEDQTGINEPTSLTVMQSGDVVLSGAVDNPSLNWALDPTQAVLRIGDLVVQQAHSVYLTRIDSNGTIIRSVEIDPPPSVASPVTSVFTWNTLRTANGQIAFNCGEFLDPSHVRYATKFIDENFAAAGEVDMSHTLDFSTAFDGARLIGIDQTAHVDGMPALVFYTLDDQLERAESAPLAELIATGVEGEEPRIYSVGDPVANADRIVLAGATAATASEHATNSVIIAFDNPLR